MDWTKPNFEAIVNDRLIELPDLVLRKIIRELIFVNDARNIKRAYTNSERFMAVFEASWKETIDQMRVSRKSCGFCQIHNFINYQYSRPTSCSL